MQRFIRETRAYTADELTPQHVRLITVVRLPFHLCTGPLHRVDDPDERTLHLWLRNQVSIASNLDRDACHSASFALFRELEENPKKVLTEAYIVDANPTLRDGEFEAIKTKSNAGNIGCASPINPGFQLLNQTIAAHQMVRIGPYISSGVTDWPGMIPLREMFERVMVEFVLLCDPGMLIEETLMSRVIDSFDKLHIGERSGSTGEIQDFTPDQLGQFPASIRKIRRHAYYELAMGAISAMLSGDGRVALVMGCAALEGAHGAFVRLHMRQYFQEQDTEYNKLLSSILRDQGFYALLQLTSRVFLPPERRPSSDELSACREGIEIRNSIMHATIRGSGEYKLRQLSDSQINSGYSGIMKMYRIFVAAVEELENGD